MFCSQRCRCQEQTHMPGRVLLFIFNLREKKFESVILTFTNCYDCYSLRQVYLHTHIISHLLEQPSVVSTAANESILAPLSNQTESSHSPHEIGRLTTSH
jgi:hypothetical protein